MNKVGLFFFVNEEVLFHGCSLDEAESYGEYLIYPESHFDIWEKYYEDLYKVDFDYYPRGRVVYNRIKEVYIIYYDQCAENEIAKIESQYAGEKVVLALDEHYQCHICNLNYVKL